MHRSRLSTFVIDCKTSNLEEATHFWSQALRREVGPEEANSPTYRTLVGSREEPLLLVQQVEHEGRVHLDIEADDLEAEVLRLEALGAKRVAFVKRWWVMEAPTGQRFCIVNPQRGPIPPDPASPVGKEGNLSLARDYLKALEQGATGDALARFFDPEVIQEEHPNRLVPQGAKRHLGDILEAAQRGQKILRSQRYEVLEALESGPLVSLQVHWTGVLAVPVGTLAPGDAMRAHFAVFFRFKAGLILSQRNYDCFEPW